MRVSSSVKSQHTLTRTAKQSAVAGYLQIKWKKKTNHKWSDEGENSIHRYSSVLLNLTRHAVHTFTLFNETEARV